MSRIIVCSSVSLIGLLLERRNRRKSAKKPAA
jgi:hypothetical protein